jgi:subtilisin family serine protease
MSIVPGQVVVLTRGDASIGLDARHRLVSREARLSAALTRWGLVEGREQGVARSAGTSARGRVMLLESTRPDFDPVAASRELQATGRFAAVSPNYRLRLFATVPNDPDLPLQYYIHATNNADIQLADAWDVTTGSPSVLIGIMDTGTDLGHPDLASKIWTNTGEVPGNGLDDDGNGFIDDVHGWDFGTDDNDPNPHAVFDASGLDVGFHGTFVSAIAAAGTNNAEGVAGAGWQCRIVPLKVANLAGEITSESVAAAFQYAWENGVSVLNMSLGGPGDPGVPEFFQALVDTATAHGVLCVAAAGNDGTDVPSYPAGCNHVLSVGATDGSNARAEFSNYGSWVKVAAPGAEMWSALCTNYEIDEVSQIFYIYFFLWDAERPYMYCDGTSFACPLVSGVCGLVRSRWPNLTPLQVLDHVVATGDDVAYDFPIGKKVNAFRAVNEPVLSVPPPASVPASMELSGATPNPFVTRTMIRFALSRPGSVRLAVFDGSGRMVRELMRTSLDAGPHAADWDGADASGHTVPAGLYFLMLKTPDGVRGARVARVQ